MLRANAVLILALVAGIGVTSAQSVESDEPRDQSSVNRSIAAKLDQRYGDLESVNGNISVAANVQAQDVSTVNGSIEIAGNSSLRSVESVNGDIEANGRLSLQRGAQTVNGAITLKGPSAIEGSVESVNGGISLYNAEVRSKVITVNGEVDLQASRIDGGVETTWGGVSMSNSQVNGLFRVRKPNSMWNWGRNKRPPRIEIGPNSTVNQLVLEHETEVLLHSSSKIGSITGPLVGGSIKSL